ncbi:MAG: outer membrane beta-barrel domain-containing protein [Rhizobacter sp.]
MPTQLIASLLLAAATCAAQAQGAPADTKEKPANEQVIVPQIDRRDVRVPKFPSNDFEMGLFAGTYATENFGSAPVYGVRLGYHITEDFFVEGAYGMTKASDENLRAVLPAGLIAPGEEKINYYNVSVGWNVLPGEIFLGRNRAKASSLYVIAGVGNTTFIKQRRQTYNFGVGSRVFFADWCALQLDVRDHIFAHDLLGQRKSTQNLEFTLGLTFFF